MGNKKKTGRSKTWKLAGEPVYPSALSSEEEHLFAGIFFWNEMFSIDNDSPLFEVPASLMKTRESAARACLEYFCRQFSEQYRRETIVEALATAVSLPTSLTEGMPDMPSFLLGAALWILDYITDQELEGEFSPLLPAEPDDEIIFRVPAVDDFTHSWADILRLMSVLYGRKGKHRKAFRSVLSLIDKETAARLRDSFKDVLLDYFGRLLEVCTRVKKPAAAARSTPPFALVSKPALDDLLDLPESPFSPRENSPDVLFLMQTMILIGAPMEELQSELQSRKSAELLAGFTVRDPYMTCAAYLLLEKEGDVLTALNMLTGAVVACADRHLPWGLGVPLSYGCPFEDSAPDYTLRHPISEPSDKEEDDDGLPFLEADAGQRLSEAQLFYLATGYALPRDVVPSRRLTAWFVEQGLAEDRARELTWGAMISSYLDDWRNRDIWERDFSWDIPDDGGQPVVENEPEAVPEVQSNNTSEVGELERQLREMRRALHDAERAAKQFQDRLLETEHQARSDHDELLQLRDTLFRIRSGEETEETDEVSVELPCQIRRRVLAFGGHDTWRKAIKPLLPGVRFVDRETLPDISALKIADVIWIQPNAISHKFYYRIIDTARKNGIPVRYFGFASARKCAEQLAVDELSAEGAQ